MRARKACPLPRYRHFRENSMANAFMEIAFTPNVQALQARMGSRDAYARGDQDVLAEPVLGPYEIPFIEARDSFYLGTVSETGWPYVQHRGGPTGFLKVLDPRQLHVQLQWKLKE